ncbi:MAG TPA: tyrosine-type recombinase/integrase [Sulfurovum sp.]|jgi:integrase/recombinase XerC|nr:MAG: integrase [Sulfurovum sp. 35-42-20]OYY56722.1 MAG: integrase [Sulfurovum sp. 28-43-6]OYZ24817.1 MAG: integrase [Sulfurovum sp. 16-42-52]OYZ49309.1 MAG: integrase [Sulfurovum sp. 24-42-9]OZA44784.1 MAG: integrase [Sulfurovum sp. 17-42-90]OZA59471.1 MAG: integrase [Sulfurovum sp. 39-42-12]HQR73934.1 tyrosine-type recombinase/integrase [Sulfurovum sp.]
MRESLQVLYEDFLTYLLDVRGYSLTSVVTYEIILRQMSEVSHDYQEEGLRVLDITPYRFKIVKNNKKTIMKKLSAIHSFVKYLEDQCHIPVKLIGDESIKVPKSLPKPIEEQSIDEVLAKANLEEKLLVSMLYGLGLRISELSALELKDIKKEWVQIHGKGNKVRELPLLENLSKLISVYVNQKSPKKYLFEKGNAPMNAAQLRYMMTKLFKESGFKVTPHQLRHSFATHLLHHGARIADVSELLGHETMATTQVYTKLGSVKKMQEYMKAHPLADMGKN